MREINPAKIFERTNITTLGYYCYIAIKNKNNKIINFYKRMTIEECITWKIKFSKTKREDSPWNTSFDQMAWHLKQLLKLL